MVFLKFCCTYIAIASASAECSGDPGPSDKLPPQGFPAPCRRLILILIKWIYNVRSCSAQVSSCFSQLLNLHNLSEEISSAQLERAVRIGEVCGRPDSARGHKAIAVRSCMLHSGVLVPAWTSVLDVAEAVTLPVNANNRWSIPRALPTGPSSA